MSNLYSTVVLALLAMSEAAPTADGDTISICGRKIKQTSERFVLVTVALHLKDGVLSKRLKSQLLEINQTLPGNHQFLNFSASVVEQNRWINRAADTDWFVGEILAQILSGASLPEAQKALEEKVLRRKDFFDSHHEAVVNELEAEPDSKTFEKIVDNAEWDEISENQRYRVGLYERQDSVRKENYVILSTSVLRLRDTQPELFSRMMDQFIRYFSMGWAAAQGDSGLKQLRMTNDRSSAMFFEVRIMRNDYRILGSIDRRENENIWRLEVATNHVDSLGGMLRRMRR